MFSVVNGNAVHCDNTVIISVLVGLFYPFPTRLALTLAPWRSYLNAVLDRKRMLCSASRDDNACNEQQTDIHTIDQKFSHERALSIQACRLPTAPCLSNPWIWPQAMFALFIITYLNNDIYFTLNISENKEKTFKLCCSVMLLFSHFVYILQK